MLGLDHVMHAICQLHIMHICAIDESVLVIRTTCACMCAKDITSHNIIHMVYMCMYAMNEYMYIQYRGGVGGA